MQNKRELVRIQKVLSESGIMSRRKAEDYIEKGKVTVNGRKASIGQKIDPARDIIAVEGVRVDTRQHQKKIYLALHKPRGYVTTMDDELDRRCVAQLVQDAPARVYPVGRLDRNSEGLLLMTNDGDFANQMMHPRYHIPKCYRVTVRPDMNDEQAMRLAEGVELDGQAYRARPGDGAFQGAGTRGRPDCDYRRAKSTDSPHVRSGRAGSSTAEEDLYRAGSAWHAAAGKMADADPAGTVSAAVCDTQRPGHG